MSSASVRSRSRSAARLAAVQALYQRDMEKIPVPVLLHEFHQHRLGATIEDVEYADAEVDFFDDIVTGVDARADEISPKAGPWRGSTGRCARSCAPEAMS
jgi:N utilization substance protein B